jgi:hypothetical protein
MVKRGSSIRVDLGLAVAGARMAVVVVSMMKMAVMGMALIPMGKIRVRVLFPDSLNPFGKHDRAHQEDDDDPSENEPWIKRFGQNPNPAWHHSIKWAAVCPSLLVWGRYWGGAMQS